MPDRRLCYLGWADHVHTERWAGHFARQGDVAAVISMSGQGQYPAGTRQFKLGLANQGPRWKAMRLRWLLWRIRPRIVHVHWAHFAVLARAAWRGPLVVTAWGSDIYRRDQYSDREWMMLGDALRSSQLVTCDSEDLVSTLIREFRLPADRVRLVQWGVDTEAFSPQGPNLREPLGLQGREVVYSARNFTPLYNQEAIVQAFARVRRRRPQAFLLMKNYGGDAAYLERIRLLISQLGLAEHVRILDKVPYAEMPALYRTADVTVSVPLSDATPMSLFEAMASGSPCVVCDLPSLREWVTNGETGYRVQASDITTLAERIEMLLSDASLGARMCEIARRNVLTRASQHAHMTSMADLYDALPA